VQTKEAADRIAGAYDPTSEFAGITKIDEGLRRGTQGSKISQYGFEGGYIGFSGMFAKGGYIPPGSWGIAGESGPEVISRKRAVAGPATVTPIRAGGDRPIVVNQTIVSQGGMRELRASRGEMAQRSAADLRRSMRMQ
jgi:hypothetical protein